jgi:endonuclease/exonuclease/phosphatase family metal-dependent hydrolase
VLSKHPIAAHEILDKAPGGWFPSQRFTLETPLGPVQFLNVHLRPPATDSGNKVIGYLTTGGTRRREITHLVAQLDPALPRIVLGDFNDGDDSSALKFLEKQGYQNALPQFDAKTPTWRGRHLGLDLKDRPDHVLYSPPLHAYGARVIPETSSDHDPVLAVIGRK